LTNLPVESDRTVTPRRLLALVAVVGLIGLYVVAMRLLADRPIIPVGFEWLAASGPLLTAFTALTTAYSFIFGRYRSCQNASIYSAIMALVATGLCAFLTLFHNPLLHLSTLFFLFVVFWIWDYSMVNHTTLEREVKDEIWVPNRYINAPTVLAVFASLGVILLMLLVGGDLRPIADAFTHCDDDHLVKSENSRWIVQCFTNEQVRVGFVSAFVYGLVTFHLFISATAYLITTHMSDLYNRLRSA
jgi:hypothetical protein